MDKFGFKKIREGVWWEILDNYKSSGMKIILTLKQNPKGRPKSKLIYEGTISSLQWDDMDEYVTIKCDDGNHKFMIEDLYRLEPYKIMEGETHESNKNN